MSEFAQIPLAEAILVSYLHNHPDVIALGARVATKTPDEHVFPWVRVTQLDGRDKGSVEHLIDFLVHVDCFSGDTDMKAGIGAMAALTLGVKVRAALKNLQGQIIDGATISGVSFVSMGRSVDTTAEPARDRYSITASIGMHS